MKKILSLLVFCSIVSAALSQVEQSTTKSDEYFSKKAKERVFGMCPMNYISIGTGINNPTGLLGVSASLGLDDMNSLSPGIGLGLWGVKSSLLYRRVIRGCSQRGMMLYAGFSYSRGTNGSLVFETTDDNNEIQTYSVDLEGAFTADFGMIFNVRLGGRSKVEFFVGGEVGLTETPYINTTANKAPLSRDAKTLLNIMKPGGITLGVAFSFGTK